MTRPRIEVRQAAREALAASVHELGGATWRTAAVHAQVGFDLACSVWHDMRRARELVDHGTVVAEGTNRPMVYCTPASASAGGGSGDMLLETMRSWAQFR